MINATLGQVLVNDALPPQYRDYTRVIKGNAIDDILGEIARQDPKQYNKISKKLLDLGADFATDSSVTVGLDDLISPVDRAPIFEHARQITKEIRDNPALSKAEKREAVEGVYSNIQKALVDETYKRSLKSGNMFARQVEAKARGNPLQLAAMVTSPAFYRDAKDKAVPVFIERSFAEGLAPHEMWASAYGARKGVKATKFATREGGDLGKQLTNSMGRLTITKNDCGDIDGVDMAADDDDNIGSILTHKVAGYPAGTIIDRKVMAKLAKQKIKNVTIRSPLNCKAKGGICAKCAGVRENNKLPEVGYSLGIIAGSSLAERVAQGALNCIDKTELVRMADWSTKPIGDINVGEYVMGVTNEGVITPTEVTHTFDNGIREVYETSFRPCNQKTITAKVKSTLDHKFWAMRHVVNQIEEKLNGVPRLIKVGQKSRQYYAVGTTGFNDEGCIEEPMALLLGLLLGDGCYTEAVSSIHLSTADEQLKVDIKDYLASLNLKLAKCVGHDYYHRISRLKTVGNVNPIKEYLKKEGMYGKYAHEKAIPDIVNSWDNKSVANLVAGLIVTDGSVYRSKKNISEVGIAFCSASKTLVKQLKTLLLNRFGIGTTTLTKVSNKGDVNYWNGLKFVNNHDMWQVTITTQYGLQQFYKQIPLCGEKKCKLSKYLTEQTPCKGNHEYIRYKRMAQEYVGKLPVCDIEVALDSHMYLLANGITISNCKHSAGQKIKGGARFTGFPVINQMVQVPKHYPNRAVVAEVDGRIDKIEEAPQGGKFVYVNGQQHYVPLTEDVTAKKGDILEAGDQLSTGLPDPADLVKHKGIGEARRLFTKEFTKVLKASGLTSNRRNIEVASRALIDNVEISADDDVYGHLPGDKVSYSRLAYNYKPRKSAISSRPAESINRYLEQPVLHYSIGTRITPTVAKNMAKKGYNKILTDELEPGFKPNMLRLRAQIYEDPDWLAKTWGSNLKGNLLRDTHRNRSTDLKGTHPVPNLVDMGLDTDHQLFDATEEPLK